MNIFIVGLPSSGRTTISKHLSQSLEFGFADATSWVKHSFRSRNDGEHIHQFHDEYHTYLTNRMKINPDLFYNNIIETIKSCTNDNFIIDGVNNPRDFIKLFDYNKDIIVFLNRTDSEQEYKDYENVGISVMRDYCFWLSSANLLPKERWIEYNFKMTGDDSDKIKTLGSKNTVFIAKTINTVKNHIIDQIRTLVV